MEEGSPIDRTVVVLELAEAVGLAILKVALVRAPVGHLEAPVARLASAHLAARRDCLLFRKHAHSHETDQCRAPRHRDQKASRWTSRSLAKVGGAARSTGGHALQLL